MIRATLVGVLLSIPEVSATITTPPPSHGSAFLEWYGLGTAIHANPCSGAAYRGFDFWLGEWSVRGAAGVDAGRSSIRSAVGGCAIAEVFGSSGRSLSAWRPQSREWLQTYVDNTGLTLRFQGRAAQDSMILADSVRHIGGSSGIALASRMTWSTLASKRVRQVWWLSRDGGATWPVNFDGIYSPDSAAFRIDSSGAGAHPCAQRPEYHALDGLIGVWSVAEAGRAPHATSRVTRALDGCMLEEQLTGTSGYERVSMIALDRFTGKWIWASVDSRGVTERFVATAISAAPISFINELHWGRGFCLRLNAPADIVVQATCVRPDAKHERVVYRRAQLTIDSVRDTAFTARVIGLWSGSGMLAGRPMTASYVWTKVSSGHEMVVALTPPGGSRVVFNGKLMLPERDSAGRWTDSQGANFAVERVALSSDSLVTAWGPASARGQSVYRLHAGDSLEVRDYRLDSVSGAATLFGRYVLRRAAGRS
jgi:hypothetical protein